MFGYTSFTFKIQNNPLKFMELVEKIQFTTADSMPQSARVPVMTPLIIRVPMSVSAAVMAMIHLMLAPIIIV